MRNQNWFRIATLGMVFAIALTMTAACANPASPEAESKAPDAPAASAEQNTETEPKTESDTISAASAALGYTVELTCDEYTDSDTAFALMYRSTDGASYITRGDKWLLYREENGELVLVGSKVTEEAIEHPVPHEYTLSLQSLGVSQLTEGVYYLQHIVSYYEGTTLHQNEPLCDLRLTVR